uniref:Uncharacterized protein n=1 Tax=uncultured marine microorganism HF4000_ANIW133B20 TaxID=455528 RepID=B3T3N0_9ZZZZ|nr:hypothetical protein ALOHA_HF4000ANIW133B20ctg3g22 [uncultured marine microorganism HF4000_ANIW133B20]
MKNTRNQGDDGDDQKNEEQDLGNFCRPCRYPAKAEKSSDQCDDKENYGIMQHHFSPWLVSLRFTL